MTETADHVVQLLERLGRQIVNDGHHQGLKPVQWEVLRFLDRANRFSRSPTALTTYLGSTKGTVSQTLMALERKGWVRKQPLARDKRSVELQLTAAGRELLTHDPLSRLEGAVDPIASEQRVELEAMLRRILTQRLADQDARPFGLCHTCRHFGRDDPRGKPHRCRLLDVPLSAQDSEKICVEQES